ncbi:hypothetical protein CU044_6973 [Streptomyces sp. L-9-10]|nr:hypothetical protein CU044_6973 [Streptomyces sp. L-9-10]
MHACESRTAPVGPLRAERTANAPQHAAETRFCAGPGIR